MSKTPPSLTYYFSSQSSFSYEPGQGLFGGNAIQVTMPTNNSSKTVMTFNYNSSNSYYTFNSFYITKSSNPKYVYQLILQGYRNDFAEDAKNQLLVIIPIHNNQDSTLHSISPPSDLPTAIQKMNNINIRNIFVNMKFRTAF